MILFRESCQTSLWTSKENAFPRWTSSSFPLDHFRSKGTRWRVQRGWGLVDVSLVVRFNAARIRDKRGECFFSQEMRKVLNVANFERMV